MRTKGVLGACLAAVLAAVACQDQTVTAPARVAKSAARATPVPAGASKKVDQGRLKLPPHTVNEFTRVTTNGDIDPGQYRCSDSSGFNNWFTNSIITASSQDPDNFWTVFGMSPSTITGYDAAIYGADGRKAERFGYTGEFTNALLRTERDVKAFWDIPSADIRLVAAHGTVLYDSARVDRLYQVAYGYPSDWAGFYAHWMVAGMQSPVMQGGNAPFLTFNAFAMPAYRDSLISTSPVIMLGDGILEDYAALGFGDVAPQAMFAHEYGHQVQYARNFFDDSAYVQGQGGPESTRYVELMADAYSGYYLTHKRGAAMNRGRVAEFLKVFYEAGDCNFYFSGHHGTPGQRMKSAGFGFAVAELTGPQGKVLTSQQFHDLFVSAYPLIVAPDSNAVALNAVAAKSLALK